MNRRFLIRSNYFWLVTACLLVINCFTAAQVMKVPSYPRNYFQWPLLLKPELVANFGELRPNHYHMGLDCRTDQKQNQPVQAAAAGYIARIKIEPFGFGRCIYINHPNGLTTLYAHLNDFFPQLEKYVKDQQYQLKSWKVFLDIPPGMFPVTKGQFIAFSGSTGGSEGPHLHFEIRDTRTEKVLNPLLFGLPIPDNIAPDLYRLAVYDRTISTYEQTPQVYALKKLNGAYLTFPSLLTAGTDKISFGISAFDRNNGSTNRNGIFQAVLYNDEVPVVGFQMDSISYDETRYLNAHIDYKMRINGGPFIEHLSRLPGYTYGIYYPFQGDGVISLEDDSIHKIRIEVWDANGNMSKLMFDLKRKTVIVKSPNPGNISPDQQKEFYPGQVNIFENGHIFFYLPEKCLYDSFRFRYREIISNAGYPIYRLHNNSVPLQESFTLKIKAAIPALLKDKLVIERSWSAKADYAKAIPLKVSDEDWYMASFREFGDFRLEVDTVAPVISPLGFIDNMNVSKLNRIAFVITDNSKELRNFNATLDGKWLLFSNDKGKVFSYHFDEMCPPGQHELIIHVEDLVGNSTERAYHFIR